MEEYKKKSYSVKARDDDEKAGQLQEKCKDCVNWYVKDGKYYCSQVYCINSDGK